ncbi:MAG: PepSY-like domain-containing protein [bacterium]
MLSKYLFIILLFVSFTAYAQQGNIPQEAKDSFAQLFPKATSVKWVKVDETEVNNAQYLAKFKQKGKAITVVFDEDGQHKMTKTGIAVSKLPTNISSYIKTTYAGCKISAATQIVGKSGDTFYEADIKIGGEKVELYFESDGDQTDMGSIE